jgi:hypothetical protein
VATRRDAKTCINRKD